MSESGASELNEADLVAAETQVDAVRKEAAREKVDKENLCSALVSCYSGILKLCGLAKATREKVSNFLLVSFSRRRKL